jgi:hypothetical protein
VTEQGQLLADLKALRRGRGVQGVRLGARIGPALVELARVTVEDDDVEARSLLLELLDPCVRALPDDLAVCVRAALALAPAPPSRFLDERLQWAAEKVERDVRTVRRRVDEGLVALAAELSRPSGGAGYAPDGWRVARLDATLRLDVDPVHLMEQRSVVAVRDGLERIRVGFSVPQVPDQPAHPLKLEVTAGGTLVEDVQASSPSYVTGWVDLPRPLDAGERHDYTICLTGPPPRDISPFYVLSPLWPCNRFAVTVVFPRQTPPRAVWRIDGAPTRILHDLAYRRHRLEPDDAGHVTTTFHRPQLGLSHGLQWDW